MRVWLQHKYSLYIYVYISTQSLGWTNGPMIAQACHASTAVLWQHRDHANVVEYMSDLDHMHKVVMEVKNESQLLKVCDALDKTGILYKRWVEQPENLLTGIATIPYVREQLGDALKPCSLFR